MRRVRKGRAEVRAVGFIVTWDVDSSDRRTADRLRRFIFGSTPCVKGRIYHYAGFVETEGVRYLGQSVLFVPSVVLGTVDGWLTVHGIDHEVIPAVLG